jgi:hypothetical protein
MDFYPRENFKFSDDDLSILAKEIAAAKKLNEAAHLQAAAIYLMKSIMAERKVNHEKMMLDFITDIRAGRSPQSILWRTFTTKFAPSTTHPDRDCRDEVMVAPRSGNKLTHLEYVTKTGRHDQIEDPMFGRYPISIWKVLKFTDIALAISSELGPNFICHHECKEIEQLPSGICYQQSIVVTYLCNGRSERRELAVQRAATKFPVTHCDHCGETYSIGSSPIRFPKNKKVFCTQTCALEAQEVKRLEEEEEAEHAADYDY